MCWHDDIHGTIFGYNRRLKPNFDEKIAFEAKSTQKSQPYAWGFQKLTPEKKTKEKLLSEVIINRTPILIVWIVQYSVRMAVLDDARVYAQCSSDAQPPLPHFVTDMGRLKHSRKCKLGAQGA